jgi:hypothetical protein
MKPGLKRKAREAERKVRFASEKESRRKFLSRRLQSMENKLRSPYVQGHTMKKLRLEARVRFYREELLSLDAPAEVKEEAKVLEP